MVLESLEKLFDTKARNAKFLLKLLFGLKMSNNNMKDNINNLRSLLSQFVKDGANVEDENGKVVLLKSLSSNISGVVFTPS